MPVTLIIFAAASLAASVLGPALAASLGPAPILRRGLYIVTGALLIVMASLHLTDVPPAAAGTSRVMIALLLTGFTGLALIAILLSNQPRFSISAAGLSAIALHSAIDGVIAGLSVHLGGLIGLAAVTGFVLHKIPVALATYSLGLRAAFSPLKSVWLSLSIVGAVSAIAAIATWLAASAIPPGLEGAMHLTSSALLAAAGVFMLAGQFQARWLRGLAIMASGLALTALALSHGSGLHWHGATPHMGAHATCEPGQTCGFVSPYWASEDSPGG